ncbi:hypothetical protein K435DRAFT_717444 [Dendrothele bispora CBS 962.96]|uniref:Uncharacterized protein n=1 Tax=Dendrothele bispora (strain CBS 962.96) TaxID=1314807 RepID=A0A4S8MHM1_DENBC|nr:hypothetical protein K435DRAFT_717444 [Dendrothele bispora CBS 962.96]
MTIDPLSQYASYPFDTDDSFKQGLTDILSSNPRFAGTDAQPDESTLRQIKVFYFNRVTGNSLTVDEVNAHEKETKTNSSLEISSSPNSATPQPSTLPMSLSSSITGSDSSNSAVDATISSPDEPQILSFAQIKALIESGNLDQIPNNKKIPEDLNEAAPSQSNVPSRKKPWETAALSM